MRLLTLCILLAASLGGQAQQQTYEQPVFVSIELSEIALCLDGFSITTGYYTIDNNIDNRHSSAYISDHPTVDEYIYFARHQPSYYFLVHRQREVMKMIVLQQRVIENRSTFFYVVIDPASGQRTKVPSRLSGELTALRAQELTVGHTDSEGHLDQKAAATCFFNNASYPVVPLAAVHQEVISIAQQIAGKNQSQEEELEQYIRAETNGGSLDFGVALAKEPQQYFAREGEVYDKAKFSVLLWGGAVRMLGLRSLEGAMMLWEEIQQRPLTPQEQKALQQGFME